MYRYLLVFVGLCLYACSPFTSYSEAVEIGSEDGYRTIYQSELQLKTRTFGDVKVIRDKEAFRTLRGEKPAFRDILFYAYTEMPAYHYYVLKDKGTPSYDRNAYEARDTLIQNHHYVILVSQSAPASDRAFILDKLLSLK